MYVPERALRRELHARLVRGASVEWSSQQVVPG